MQSNPAFDSGTIASARNYCLWTSLNCGIDPFQSATLLQTGHSGYVVYCSGREGDYTIRHGWDIIAAVQCDETWARSNIELLQYIEEQNFDDAKLAEVLDSIQTEDHHWNWFKKSSLSTGDEYEWFFLFSEDKPQGACLIYLY